MFPSRKIEEESTEEMMEVDPAFTEGTIPNQVAKKLHKFIYIFNNYSQLNVDSLYLIGITLRPDKKKKLDIKK